MILTERGRPSRSVSWDRQIPISLFINPKTDHIFKGTTDEKGNLNIHTTKWSFHKCTVIEGDYNPYQNQITVPVDCTVWTARVGNKSMISSLKKGNTKMTVIVHENKVDFYEKFFNNSLTRLDEIVLRKNPAEAWKAIEAEKVRKFMKELRETSEQTN